ncbi:hypothetical protein OG21DRAFT_1524278 [Imleria badia]|nr:hypothetical protein OG21DRAFT_1524278 [Imleria badia]
MSQAQPQIDPVLIEQSTGTSNNVVNKRKENVADEATGRKKKANITDFDKAKYKLVGRKLMCLLHPFGSPRTAIKVGMKIESGCEGELDDNSVEIERHHRFYEGILTHALGLAEELNSKRIIGALQEGTIKTTAASWLTCFYEEGVYDLENRAKGLFRGHSAFRFYTHLFIRPSAASTDTITSNSSKVSKNHAWGLTEVMPHVIAYVHVLHSGIYLTVISRAFPKGHGSSNNADSDDDMANIRAQRTRKKAARPPRASEKRATEATDFATPSPEDLKNPLPTDPSLLSSGDPSIPLPTDPSLLSSGDPSIPSPSSGDPSIPSSRDPSGPSPSSSDASSSEGSSIFSGSAAAVIESNLSSCMLDNEADPTPTVYTGKTNTTGPSTVTSAPTSIPAPAPPSNSDPSIIPTEPKKQGCAPATKKPHRRGGKKSNEF